MGEIVNPYIAGAPVTEQRMFFGREDIFQWIESSIAGQYADHILVIHGQRRVGKTSVLKQLGNRLPKRYIPVFFDLQGRTHTTLDRFLWWLAREIVRVLKQDRAIEFPLPDRGAFSADIEYFEHRFLSDLQPVLADNLLLLTFDEFDNLEESEVKEELARPLTDYLRRLMGNGSLNFIFSIGSSGRKLENMQAAYTEFFKTALYKKISFLNEDQTRKLITLPVESIIEYDRNAVTRIYKIAGGHPYFTQLTCHELFSKCQQSDDRRITEADVESILDDVVERGTVNLKFVWDEASDIEKWGLTALAQSEKSDHRSLADYLRKQRVRFSESDLTSGLLHLREKDVLTPENRFVIHLLKLWLQKNRPIEQAREELTEVNPIANRYIEIGLEFRDAGIFDKAIESFQEALAVSKDNIQAQVNIALTYMDQRAYGSAVVEFEKALTMDDEDVSARAGLCEAHLALGDMAMQKGRTKDAIQSYLRVLGINTEHTEARGRMTEIARQRAEKALEDGRDEEALSAFAEALKYTPEDPSLIERVEKVQAEKKAKVLAAQVARSEKEANARNWEKAIAALNEALQIAPEDESILRKITDIKERQLQERLSTILAKADQAEKTSRWDVAIAALKEYLSLKPGNAAIQKRLDDLVAAKHSAWLAAVLARAEQAAAYQKWDEAIAALNEVLTLEPENVEIQKRMNETLKAQRAARLESILKQAEQAAQAGKWDDAIDVLNHGIAQEPENEKLQAKLAKVLDARRAARLKAGLRLAETASQAGKWNAAIDSLNEILAFEPENAEVRKKLAEVRARQRESQLNELRAKARGFARAERFEEALSTWQEYLALGPDDRESALTEIESVKKAQSLARSYAEAYKAYSKKNYDKAIGLFKSIVMEDADYRDATHLMAESIDLRRTARKWWQSRWVWGAGVGFVVLAVGWFAFRADSQLMSALFAPTAAPATSTPASTLTPAHPTATSTPTLTPTPLPLAWARLDPGTFLPRDIITAIVMDPTDPGVMYVGTKKSGVYKSIDGGVSWQPAHEGLDRASILSLVIDPNSPATLYTGTSMGGVFKTTNRGESWLAINDGLDLENGRRDEAEIVMDPQDSQHLFFTQAYGIFETMDGGNTWTQVKESICPSAISALILQPQDHKTLLAASDTAEGDCQAGIYESGDAGQTWGFKGEIEKAGWLYANARGGLLYTSTYGENQAFYRSSDGGNSWEQILDNSCFSFAADPGNDQIAYCGSDSGTVERTQNSGDSWETIYNGDEEVRSLVLSPFNPQTVWAGSERLNYSNNGGKTWETRLSGLSAGDFQLVSDPFDNQVLYGLTRSNQLHRSLDAGFTWELIDDRPISSHLDFGTSPGTIIRHDEAASSYTVSNDRGVTWEDLPPGSSVEVLPGSSGKIYKAAAEIGIQYSTDGGQSWKDCAEPGLLTGFGQRLAADPQNSDHLVAASLGEGVLISRDGCQSWQASVNGLSSLFVNSVAIHPSSPNTLYAGTDGGAFISFDDGQTWGQVNDGLPGVLVVYSIVVDKDSNVYAATPYGIFKLEGD